MMMKPLLPIVVAALLVPAVAAGQESETLLSGEIQHGGFGGPVVKFTQIDDRFGVLVGGRGGWIINHSFVIGAGGYGLANEGEFDDYFAPSGDARRLVMGYGGLELEYVNRPQDAVHFSLAVLIGAGGLALDPVAKGSGAREDDAFFITEPTLQMLLNVTQHFRIGIGGSYRFVNDVELPGLRDGDIGGASGVVTLKFGGF